MDKTQPLVFPQSVSNTVLFDRWLSEGVSQFDPYSPFVGVATLPSIQTCDGIVEKQLQMYGKGSNLV